MKKNNIIKTIILITIVLVIIDQISKVIIQYKYQEPIGTGAVTIDLVKNDGIAFSMNSGNIKNIIITSMVLLMVIRFIKNQKDNIDKKTSIALSLILSGGISNLIDRIIHGGVIDFIKIKNFAIINIADCYVVIGWILLVIFLVIYTTGKSEVKNCEKQ